MELRDLRFFLTLAESQHFGLSAKQLHITPSTLSRQIQRIEKQLGHSLFIRDNRSVKITPAGIQFQQFAQQTLFNYQQLITSLNEANQTISGELRLFCSVTAAYSHLPMILDRFRARYPQIEIKITTGDAADAMVKIEKNDVDLAIAGRPVNLSSKLEFIDLDQISMSLIYPLYQSSIHEQLISPNPDWQQIPFILPEHGPSRHQIESWFRKHNITHPLIYATVAGHEAIVSMVALGCGVALLPDVVLENSPEMIKKRIGIMMNPTELIQFQLGVCVQKKQLINPQIKAFWSLLKSNDS